MVKLLSSIILILAIILFPPAVLALVSNNAVPGDATYPIKRGLEGGIYAVASLNPTSKAWFAAARSDRRFKEIRMLVNSGKQAKTTLRELVSQAEITVEEIAKVEDPARKNQLLDKYQETIEEYKKGLTELKKQVTATPEVTEPTSQPTPTLTLFPSPTPTVVTLPTPIPAAGITVPTPGGRVTPTATQKPTPTSSPRPTRTPTPFPTPTPVVSPPDMSTDPDDIDEAIDDLDKIGKKADEQKNNINTPDQVITQAPPSPSPSPTPTPTRSGSSTKFRLFSLPTGTQDTLDSQNVSPSPTPVPISPTPSCVIPAKPSGLSYISDSKTVSWDAVASASYYNVRLVTPDSNQHNFDDITNTWYTFPDDLISAPGNYSWWVDAINECGVDREGSSFTIGLP